MNTIQTDLFFAKLKLASKSDPVYSAKLEIDLKLSGVQVRDMIRELRRSGVPVANSKQGYFIAESYEEIKETIIDLESRCNSMHETVSALKKIFKNDLQNELF